MAEAKAGRTQDRFHIGAAEVSRRVRDTLVPSANFMQDFERNLEVNILDLKKDRIKFEIIGIDASVANALRRILLSEVPTMAIETVFFIQNTSIMQDEVLSHRLGLVPLMVDPDLFEDVGEDVTEVNTLVFSLNVMCRAKPGTNPGHIDPDYSELIHGRVLSGDLVWKPQGVQEQRFQGNPPRPIHDDIVITKLRPGQQITLEAHAVRGIGKDHAKFSPVCTAFYRLMPEVTLVEDVYGDRAKALMRLMPGVFELADDEATGTKKARVVNSSMCNMSRNYMQEPDLARAVEVTRVPDHFIFSVETVGAIEPADLLRRALKILANKCEATIAAAEVLEGS